MMNRRTGWAVRARELLAGALAMVGALAARAEVVAGVWNEEFTNSLAIAKEKGVPLVLIWGTEGCEYCNKLWEAARKPTGATEAFVKEHPALYVHKQGRVPDNREHDRSWWASDFRASADWVDSFSALTGRTIYGPTGSGWAFPIVAVWWAREGEEPVVSLFTGRSGSMPVKDGDLSSQLGKSLDSLIGDYVAARDVDFGPRTPLLATGNEVSQAMPFVRDLNGDGLPDLLVGVKLKTGESRWQGKVRVYLNRGTEAAPVYAPEAFSYLAVNGVELVEEQTAGGCQGLQAQFGDFNGDGFADLAVGHLEGELEVWPGTSTPGAYGEKIVLLGKSAGGGRYRSYACFRDLDGDGRDELTVGFMDGTFMRFGFRDETWTTNAVVDADGNALRLPAQSQAENRRSTPAFADLNGDGFDELVSGSTDGGVWRFPADGLGGWATNCLPVVEGEKDMERSRLAIADLNGDRVPDLVVGYADGSVAWYEGTYRVLFECEPEPSYVPGRKIEPLAVRVAPARLKPSVSVTGLPKGLSLVHAADGDFVSGTPQVPFDGDATFKVSYEKWGVRQTMTRLVRFHVAEKPRLAIARDESSTGWGKLPEGGSHLAGERVTITATPDLASVFAGWYRDGEPFFAEAADHRQPTISFAMPPVEKLSLTARFVLKSDDAAMAIACVPCEEGYAAGAVMTPLEVEVDSRSLPTLTAKGMPPGVRLDAAARTLVGTPTKPGVYPVSLTAKNKSGAKATTNVTVTVRNFVDEEIPVADSYGPFVPGAKVDFTIPEAIGCKVTGLPSGLKFASATGRVTGAAKKPGASVVVFTKTVKRVNCNRKASATFTVGPFPVLSVAFLGNGSGKVKGAGAHAANSKVTLKATAGKGSVFAGWFAGGELRSLAASCKLTMPGEDLALAARFVTKSEDAEGVKLAVGGVELPVGAGLEGTNVCGVACRWPLQIDTLSAETVKASGLPKGLKLVKGKELGEYALEGTPSVPSARAKGTGLLVPSLVKLTVKTAGKATRTWQLRLTVLPREGWAVGAYDGPVECEAGLGVVTATIAANGKVSGKCLIGKKSYSFSAPSLVFREGDALGADVTVKIAAGVTVADSLSLGSRRYDEGCEPIGTLESADDVANFTVLSNAVQNLWKRSDASAFPLPVFAKGTAVACAYDDPEFGVCELAFKFGAKGAVTIAGKVNGGSVSASARLLLDDIGPSACRCFGSSYNGRIVVAFKTLGYCRAFDFAADREVGVIGAADIVLDLAAGALP